MQLIECVFSVNFYNLDVHKCNQIIHINELI